MLIQCPLQVFMVFILLVELNQLGDYHFVIELWAMADLTLDVVLVMYSCMLVCWRCLF